MYKWVNVFQTESFRGKCEKHKYKKHNRCWYIKFAKKFGLVSLKSNTYKLHIRKLETTPVDLSKLSDVVNNETENELD